MKDVEIFSLGDELLRGVVQDSNSFWMAKRLAARGANLTRIQVLPDAPPVIADELRRAFERRPSLVLTQGGLGPTDDDRTREAIGLATDRPLVLHPGAEEIVRRRYRELAADGKVDSHELNDARIRMAMLPEGARALDNHVGGAPGVLLETDETTIVALPGVPPELHWIWENTLSPELDRILGPGGFAELTWTLDLRDESLIADLLRALQARHPAVYVKSRAKGFDAGEEVRVTLTAAGSDDDSARKLVDPAAAELRGELATRGISVLTDP
ncbi:MAG: competence/damage-inducible protein A [Actinomycetota bacterium]